MNKHIGKIKALGLDRELNPGPPLNIPIWRGCSTTNLKVKLNWKCSCWETIYLPFTVKVTVLWWSKSPQRFFINAIDLMKVSRSATRIIAFRNHTEQSQINHNLLCATRTNMWAFFGLSDASDEFYVCIDHASYFCLLFLPLFVIDKKSKASIKNIKLQPTIPNLRPCKKFQLSDSICGHYFLSQINM